MAYRREIARAKINLTLEIKGRRADGYHELESLVLFADFGDEVACRPDAEFGLEIDGPFAANLDGVNLIEKAAHAFASLSGAPARGAFRLSKHIPVAAGLGGGSADAAAALRLMAAASTPAVSLEALTPIARQIGADVPVCLLSRAAIMSGVGECLRGLAPVAPVPALLVNPMLPLATRDVFRELRAERLTAAPEPPLVPAFQDFDELIAYARQRGNDLEAPARRLMPLIGDILAQLEHAPGSALARLSGSGPTCFALFRTDEEAHNAASTLRRAHPEWWVKATTLG